MFKNYTQNSTKTTQIPTNVNFWAKVCENSGVPIFLFILNLHHQIKTNTPNLN